MFPHRLQDVVHCNIPLKLCNLKSGPIISDLISVWRLMSKHTKSIIKIHQHFPLFHNYDLLLGGWSASFPHWSDRGIHIISDITKYFSLRSFQDIQQQFKLPTSSFFFYLHLRSALNVLRIPRGQELPQRSIHCTYYFIGKVWSRNYISC